MYIRKIQFSNLRTIDEFEMILDGQPGWHVILGENGAGKTTVLKAIAMALIGPEEIRSIRIVLSELIQQGKEDSEVRLSIIKSDLDGIEDGSKTVERDLIPVNIKLVRISNSPGVVNFGSNKLPYQYLWGNTKGWFSISFGAYRRLSKDPQEQRDLYKSSPKAAAHQSLFEDNVGFTESLSWLSFLRYQSLERNQEASLILESLKILINEGGLLPNNTKLSEIGSEGVIFIDGNHKHVDVMTLSEGYKSVLSMFFELIRQLVRVYGADLVFANIKNRQMSIDVEGIVLIDEIDAHLHPTWQTQIGKWLINYFPKLQFIVTTHSPLICRASENGTIWRLSPPGSEEESGKVTGLDYDRLIYGNVLDAYGTEMFGKDIEVSEESIEQRELLLELSKKNLAGKLSSEESIELLRLKRIFATDDPIEL